MLLSGKGTFHSRGDECDGHVTCDTFICKVPSVQEPAPGGRNMKTVSSRPAKAQGLGLCSLGQDAWHMPS